MSEKFISTKPSNVPEMSSLEAAKGIVQKQSGQARKEPTDQITALMHPLWEKSPAPIRIYTEDRYRKLKSVMGKEKVSLGDVKAFLKQQSQFEDGDTPAENVFEAKIALEWTSRFNVEPTSTIQEDLEARLAMEAKIKLFDITFECLRLSKLEYREGRLFCEGSFYFSGPDYGMPPHRFEFIKTDLEAAYKRLLYVDFGSGFEAELDVHVFTLRDFSVKEIIIGPNGRLKQAMEERAPAKSQSFTKAFTLDLYYLIKPRAWENEALGYSDWAVPAAGVYDAQVSGVSVFREEENSDRITRVQFYWTLQSGGFEGTIVSESYSLTDAHQEPSLNQIIWGWLGCGLLAGDLNLNSLAGRACKLVLTRHIAKGYDAFYYMENGQVYDQVGSCLRIYPKVVLVLPAGSNLAHGLTKLHREKAALAGN